MRILAPAKRLLVWALAVVVGILVLVLFFEEKLIYFPHREMEVTPADLALPFVDCWLTTEDGARLHGWFFPLEGARVTVLVCHGNAGNISHRLDRVLLMRSKLQTEVMLFDYRGYGRSEGRPGEQETYRDARAAYRFLTDRRQVAPQQLVLFGESLGAAVAVQLASEVPAKALVLESAFTSIPDMARAIYPFLPVRSLLRTRYDNLAKIAEIGVPLLVLHGNRDEVVPFEQGEKLFEAAPEPKRFYAIPGAGHNDTFFVGGDAYWRVWKEFLESLI